jgi:hypothetical protein
MRGAMSQVESSYIQIYRDLLLNPSFVGLPPSYRCVLFSLLANACFAPWQQDDHGVLIDLLPGQFMCTIRYLADLANVGKNDAERALKKFVEMKIVRLEVRHKKTIVTILYGIKFKSDETTKETGKRQDRDTKEEALASSSEEPKPSPNQEIKKTTTTTRKSPLLFSGKISEEEKNVAKKAYDLILLRSSKEPDEGWNIELKTLEKLFHIFGIPYITDQFNYLINRMEKYRKNKLKPGNKIPKIDDPNVYFDKACSENWAKSLHTGNNK